MKDEVLIPRFKAAVKLAAMVKAQIPKHQQSEPNSWKCSESSIRQFITTGECNDELKICFNAVKALAEGFIKQPKPLDYTVVAEG
ncbi:hypothetical protein KCP70_20930 [Salmonella enterica subsp. enterica]|nr:hypothetical protein KCP70_20930 [Salmonella enterica subsp. enterica]